MTNVTPEDTDFNAGRDGAGHDARPADAEAPADADTQLETMDAPDATRQLEVPPAVSEPTDHPGDAEPVPLIEPDEPVTPYEPVPRFEGRLYRGPEQGPGAEASAAGRPDADAAGATASALTAGDAPTAAYPSAFEPRYYEPPTQAYPQPALGDYGGIGQLGLGQQEPDATQPPPFQQQPIYVQAPIPPTKKGNRGIGTLIALVGTVAFGLLYAGLAALIILLTNSSNETFAAVYTRFLTSWMFWAALIGFTVVLIAIVLIVNRANWWAYVIFGFLVGAGAYIATLGGAYISASGWNMTQSEGMAFLAQVARSPFTIAAGVAAREVAVWIGAWIAARARKVKLRNSEAQVEYQRQLQATPGLRPAP